jgi:hypothetical protein
MSTIATETLESQCAAILKAIAQLPPFRRGTVTAHPRTCGKPSCRCSQSISSRHESYQWTATIHGEKLHKTIHLGPEVAKYLDETATYRRFLELIEQFVSLNEQRADQLQPVMPSSNEKLDTLKKKLRKQLSKPPRKKSVA